MSPDPRSTAAIVATALPLDIEDEERWNLVCLLQRTATAEVFEAVVELCRSTDPAARLLGVDVLGQLGVETRPFREQALPLLMALLDDANDVVAGAAGVALGHHSDLGAVDGLVGKADHASDEVRRGVVHGLLGLDDRRAIDALIRLSRDEDAEVRDWATFGLGTQIDRDTPEIRDALLARVRDPDEDTRDEAIVGLAARGDLCVIEPLDEALAAGLEPGPLLFEAAELMRPQRS